MSGKRHNERDHHFQQYLPGRPLKFEKVEDMQQRIDEYFDWCDARIQQVYSAKEGGVIEVNKPAPYTMAGLGLALDLSRQSLLNYKTRKDKNGQDFLDTIEKAKSRVASDVENRLMEGNQTGAIFNLKNNFGYVDQTTVDGTQKLIVETRKRSSAPASTGDADDNEDD